jgi:lipopolysaccharide/colanic/teichoic acid biosynthesis glycosyltransferase
VKRALDLIGATIGLVVLSPVLGILAVLVKLESRGSAFFARERVGRSGRLFRIFKLRTMVDGAEAKRDELLAQSVCGDPTAVQGAERSTDDSAWPVATAEKSRRLPQLVNVLLGEMSLSALGRRCPRRWHSMRRATMHAST